MDQEVESFDLTNGDTVLPKSSRGVLDLCSAGDLDRVRYYGCHRPKLRGRKLLKIVDKLSIIRISCRGFLCHPLLETASLAVSKSGKDDIYNIKVANRGASVFSVG